MAKPCDFCGNSVKEMDAYYRPLNKGNVTARICGSCEVKLRGLFFVNDTQKTIESVKWGKGTINSGRCNPDVAKDLIEQIVMTEKAISSEVQSENIAPAAKAQNSNPIIQNNSNYINKGAVDDSTMWTEMLKIISVIAVIGLTIAGVVIGGMMSGGGGAFIGFFVGLLVGMISISTLMVFVNMAEDTKATREYVRQIRNMMNENNNK